MDYVKLVTSKLRVDEIIDTVSSPSFEHVSLFVGTVSEYFDKKKIALLKLEANEPVVLKAMEKICEDVRQKWRIGNMAIYQRLGVVPVKEASIVIAVSSSSKVMSMQAAHFAAERQEATVPITKQEESQFFAVLQNIKQEPQEVVKQEVMPHLIQIKADSHEIQRRINSFIERKREQVNQGNIQDFCFHDDEGAESSCARVNALLMRRKDSKSHLRVRRVLNTWGPQTRNMDSGTVIPPGIEERLTNAEYHLKVSCPVPKDIYNRLKHIEDRILHLEGLSPEYFQFWSASSSESKSNHNSVIKKRTYSLSEVESKLSDLEYSLGHKD